jgi:hypothetical protein
MRQANAGRVEALEQMRRLRRQVEPEPVSVPQPRPKSIARPALG